MTHRQSAMAAAVVLGMVLGWIGFVQAAGTPAWPAEWTAFGPVPRAAGMETTGHPGRDQLLPGSVLASIPDTLEIGSQTYKGKPVSPDAGGRFDLGALFGGAQRGNTVYLLAPVTAESSTVLAVGAGADWWMQWWLDGRPVFDTLATGNRKAPISPDNYTFELSLAQGDHVLAVAVISGSGEFMLTAGLANQTLSGYAEAMEAGREARFRCDQYYVTEALGEARAAYAAAAERAATDTEKAAALLGLAAAWQAERRAPDRDTVRRLCQEVLGLAGAGAAQWGDAALLLGDAWRDDRQFDRAREAYAQAAAVASRPGIARKGYTATRYVHKGQSATARSYLLEGNLSAARQVLDELLARDWMAEKPELRGDAEALREVVDLAGQWDGARRARIEDALAALRARDPNDRAGAADALGVLGAAEAVPRLAEVLRDAHADVRCHAAAALGRIGDAGGTASPIPALVAALDDLEPRVRRTAADALGRMPDSRAVEPLVARLKDKDPAVRCAGAAALAMIADARTTQPLAEALADADPGVRREALNALVHSADDLATILESVIAALNDSEPAVRRQAAEALGRASAGTGLDPLIAALRDADPSVRRTAAESLGRLGDPRAVEPLIPLDTDSVLPVKQAARGALQRLTGATVAPLGWKAWWDQHRAALR